MLSPKRILHVCSLNLFRYGQSFYSMDWKIRNGLIRNGHHVYDFNYREVAKWENPFRTSRFGTGKMNKRLLQTVAGYMPDLILFSHSELVSPETIELLRHDFPHVRLAQWYVDSIAFPEKRMQLVERGRLMDVVFATTGGELLRGLKSEDNRVAFFPNICDSAIESHKNFETDELPLDFLFCGRDYSAQRSGRIKELVTELGKKKLRCEVWGCLGNPVITGNAYFSKLAEAASALNLSHADDVAWYSSDRMTQLAGCGILTFTPDTPKMKTLFSENEVVYFSDDAELFEKLVYYAENVEERREIAANGHIRCHGSYNAERVTKFMLEAIYQHPFSEQYEWCEEWY